MYDDDCIYVPPKEETTRPITLTRDGYQNTLTFASNYKIDGYFILWDGFRIACERRPSILHRVAMRVVFGWKWESVE